MQVTDHLGTSMTNVSPVVAKCGSKLFADAPQGFCSLCLFKTGLGPLQDEDEDALGSSAARMQMEFGDYKLLEEIGRGGQGVVYRAHQKSLNRTVALKVIGLGQWASKANLKRFRREAEAAAHLEHPGIVPIHEVGERDGQCYFSMKFIEGGQLDEVARREPMPIRGAVELIAKVARTVHYAHEHGILHRDIKPGNILLDQKGEPHLTDFGLARLVESESTVTRTMEVLGTPSYMAPEQAVGNNAAVSSVTDVYGLGAVLYQLLTGQPPFAGGTTYETIKLLLDTEPRQPRLLNPKIDRDLSTICLKCLEKDPKRRYSSALALAEDLERWFKHEPIQASRAGVFTRGRKWVRRNPTSALLAASLVALAAASGWIVWKSELIRQPVTTSPPPEKSIAVLPFENFSDNKENSYFAAGIQDDVLTSLAQIHDLKVISRTSVMAYQKPGGRNMREISQALGVANVLEGSVRRTGNRVLVNVQLIDARNDRHIWAERYDRAVADSIGLQGELAAEIAKVLQAKLDPEEKASLGTKPTNNPEAYVLYLRALELEQNAETLKPPLLPTTEDWKAVAQLYAQAIALDPAFALARARASISYSQQFFQTQDPALKAKARTLAEEALRLSPALGEAHLALGLFFYLTERNYTAALEQFTIALTALPNNVEVLNYIARIYRQQGRWRAAIGGFEQARSLNPRVEPWELVFTYWMVRDWRAAAAAIKRNVALTPDEPRHRVGLAQIEVVANCDLAAARAKLREIPAGVDPDGVVTLPNWNLSMLERDFATAEKWLADFPSDKFPGASPKSFYQAQTALARGDVELARTLFEKVRPALESNVRDHPAAARHHGALGILYGYMGRKEDAIRESRRAVELCPESTDAVEGVQRAYELALVYALTGETDQALPLIERLLRTPGATTRTRFYDGGITQAELRLRWQWDKLRGDPRFKKILDGPEPKTVY